MDSPAAYDFAQQLTHSLIRNPTWESELTAVIANVAAGASKFITNGGPAATDTLLRKVASFLRKQKFSRNVSAHNHDNMQCALNTQKETLLRTFAADMSPVLSGVVDNGSFYSCFFAAVLSSARKAAFGSAFFGALTVLTSWSTRSGAQPMMNAHAALAKLPRFTSWSLQNFERMLLHYTVYSDKYFDGSLRIAIAEYSQCFFGSLVSIGITLGGFPTLDQLKQHALVSLRTKVANHRAFGSMFTDADEMFVLFYF